MEQATDIDEMVTIEFSDGQTMRLRLYPDLRRQLVSILGAAMRRALFDSHVRIRPAPRPTDQHTAKQEGK